MLKAKDFRRYAREALKGRWLKAGATGLVAGFLGAAISTGIPSGSSSSGAETGNILSSNMAGGTAAVTPDIPAVVFALIMGIALVFLLYAIVLLVIGGATTLGYAKYNLNLVDDNNPQFKDIFSQYNRLGTGFGMQFFRGLFAFLWSLLLVIPGIIASYRYYMTPFILCENPNMTAREAIRESKALMRGNKWRLFCLELSFIGWELLAVVAIWGVLMAITMPLILISSTVDEMIVPMVMIMFVVLIAFVVILSLTLSPYITASIAVFYREISEGRYSNPHVEGESGDYTYREADAYYEEAPVQEVVEEPIVIEEQPLAEPQDITEE